MIPIGAYCYSESDLLIPKILRCFNEAFNTGRVHNCLKDVIITYVFKKGTSTDCNNYRGLSLISHLGKCLERMIQNRLSIYVESINFIPESQNGFRQSRSTVDSMFCSKMIATVCREKNIGCYKCFVDLTKAYDKVDRNALWKVLYAIGVPSKMIELIKQIHVGAMARVRVDGELSEPFELGVGLKQGSVFAPLLFNIYFAAIVRATKAQLNNFGILFKFKHSNGDVLSNQYLDSKLYWNREPVLELLFADDCAIITREESELQIVMNVFHEIWTTNFN